VSGQKSGKWSINVKLAERIKKPINQMSSAVERDLVVLLHEPQKASIQVHQLIRKANTIFYCEGNGLQK